jgi:tRNA (uracil-5-)-methyltransferase
MGFTEDGKHVVIVPFCVPGTNLGCSFVLMYIGDKVLAKVHTIVRFDSSPFILTHVSCSTYSQADLVSVIEPSKQRNDNSIKCRYFGKCSGCQLQMISYEVFPVGKLI